MSVCRIFPLIGELLGCSNCQRFLWVKYLLDEICAGSCDADIRQALRNLPRSLEDTYIRVLSRIATRKNRIELIQRVFRWVAVAKRPLAVEELREAVAINIGQTKTKPELMPHDMRRVVLWTDNLLQITEEEPQHVCFAHSSIYDFMAGARLSQQLPEFFVDLKEANHFAGEICVTYLHFDEFQKTIARRRPPVHIDPVALASTVLSRELKLSKLTPGSGTLAKLVSKHGRRTPDIVTTSKCYSADDAAAMKRFQSTHAFLQYAETHWTSHATDFRKGSSSTWDLFLSIISADSTAARRPWGAQQHALVWWTRYGHFDIVEALLAAGADANAIQSEGQSALAVAILAGHHKIEQLLLRGGARPVLHECIFELA